jgi:UrcA family protein
MFTTANNRFITLLAVFTAGVALLSAPVQAAAGREAPSVSVYYTDLDLTTENGVSALYRRLQMAARRVCAVDGREIENVVARRACYAQVLSAAVATINLETLSALHRNAGARARVS